MNYSLLVSKLSSFPTSHSRFFLFHCSHPFCQLFLFVSSVFLLSLTSSYFFSVMSAHSGDQVDVSALPVNTGDGASPGVVMMHEGVPVVAMVLRSGADD